MGTTTTTTTTAADTMPFDIAKAMLDAENATSEDDRSEITASPNKAKKKKARTEEAIDENQKAFMDTLIDRMGDMMDEKLDSRDKRMEKKMTKLQRQMTAIAKATERGLQQLQDENNNTKKEVKKEIKETSDRMTSIETRPAPKPHEEAMEEREKQAIVKGFDQETPVEEVIDKITKHMSAILKDTTRIHVETLTNAPTIGIVTFPNKAAKISFYKKTQKTPGVITGDKTMTFTDNKTLEERIRDKRLGYVKHFLIEKVGKSSEDVRILWPKLIVTVNHKKVAWYDDDNEMQMTKIAKAVKEDVDKAMEKWIEKRSKEPATDSD